jgi:predicted nucleotidyltransferase
MREKEFPPLLPNGFKDIFETDLHTEFVSPFTYQAEDYRNNLLVGFGSFLNEFKELNLTAEVWIDGSFATKAPDPSDVDVLFYFDLKDIAELKPEKKEKYVRLFNSRNFMRNLYGVEVHIAERNNEIEIEEWKKTFGTCYDNITPKGIFRLFYN